jgi:hypothetical protein
MNGIAAVAEQIENLIQPTATAGNLKWGTRQQAEGADPSYVGEKQQLEL